MPTNCRFLEKETKSISLIDEFIPIPLFNMKKVGLMNRVDVKYLFSVDKLPELLSSLTDKYLIMEIDQRRVFPYKTIYLDTADYDSYYQHMTGRLERFKVRYRKYVSSDVSYLEVKKKTNKGRTVKRRIPNSFDSGIIDPQAACFIRGNTPFDPDKLIPVVQSNFCRTTLVGLQSNERITLDFNISFSDFSGNSKGLPFLTIAELKKEGFSRNSYFSEKMRDLDIRPTGFSKFCTGNALLKEMPKMNLLKQRFLLLNKINNEYDKSFIA